MFLYINLIYEIINVEHSQYFYLHEHLDNIVNLILLIIHKQSSIQIINQSVFRTGLGPLTKLYPS